MGLQVLKGLVVQPVEEHDGEDGPQVHVPVLVHVVQQAAQLLDRLAVRIGDRQVLALGHHLFLDEGDKPHLPVDDLLLVELPLQLGEDVHQAVEEEQGVYVALVPLAPLLFLLLHQGHPLGTLHHFQKVVEDALRVGPGALLLVEHPQGEAAPVPGLLVRGKGGGPQLEALVLPVVQQAVGHLFRGENDRLAGRVLQGLGGGEALLLQLLGQALLYQMKCVEFQTVSLQSS